jgi:3-hydroxyacyl-[acyl-carrier-protein] dehydratase
MAKVAITVQKTSAERMPKACIKTDFFAVTDIAGYLSHRPPFLFVDHAEVNVDMSGARGVRRFLDEDWFFKGHFPGDPIVPGVILLEVAAQTANLLLSCRANRLVHAYLVNAETVSFKTPVRPGDTVIAGVSFSRAGDSGPNIKPGSFFAFRTSVLRDNQPCMRAQLSVFWAK